MYRIEYKRGAVVITPSGEKVEKDFTVKIAGKYSSMGEFLEKATGEPFTSQLYGHDRT